MESRGQPEGGAVGQRGLSKTLRHETARVQLGPWQRQGGKEASRSY